MTKKSELSLMGQMKRWIPVFFKGKKMYANIDNLVDEPRGESLPELLIEKCGDKFMKDLLKENKELKEKLALTENDRDEWEMKAKDFEKRLNKLLDNMSWMS